MPQTSQSTPFTLFESFEKTKTKMPRKRFLRYDINSLADFEQAAGMGFGQLMVSRAIFAAARALLWAGLKHEDRTLSLERVGLLIGEYLQEEVPDGEPEHSVDVILKVCFKAAKEQKALGKFDDIVDVEDQDEAKPATTSGNGNEGSAGN